MNCDPASLARAAACFCFPRGMASQMTAYLACQLANSGFTPPITTVIVSNGAGGFCKLVVDTAGNVGAVADPGPATTAAVLADGSGGFWEIIADAGCLRGTLAVAGPATTPPVLDDGSGGQWTLVVDSGGTLGATL